MGQQSRLKKRRATELRGPESREQFAAARIDAHSVFREPSSIWKWLLPTALVASVLLAYQPAWDDGFIWDDDFYVTHNKTLLDLGGLERIWFDRHANPQYYPLVHTTFWIEHHLWGPNPRGYHLVNVVLHAANVILLLLLLRRLNVPGAFWAAALFAVHPVMVESVAWITERKNVLSAFFYLCSFWELLRFWPPEDAKPQPNGRWRHYGLALLLFAAALCSKTVACSLPAAFLLVRWWKQGCLTRRDVLATAPFFAIGLVLALNTAILEKQNVGASGKEWDFSALDRVLIAGRVLWFYAATLAWPAQLTFFYPRWQIDTGIWWQYLFPLAAIGVIGALWALRARCGRGPLTAVLFFAGTLVPALGFFDVFPMRYSFVADHFQYLASIGLFALAGAAIELVLEKTAGPILRGPASIARVQRRNHRGNWALAFILGLLVILAALTWRQAGVYKDLPTLWTDTVAKNPSCWLARNNLGVILTDSGQLAEGIDQCRKALELKPDYVEAHNNLGSGLARHGQVDEAIAHYKKALELKPDYVEAHYNLGLALASRQRPGDLDEAIDHYRKALDIQPDLFGLHYNLAIALTSSGKIDEAVSQYKMALQIKPDSFEAHLNLGEALARNGQVKDAIDHYRMALDIRPDLWEAHYNLGSALARQGQTNEANEHYQKALDLATARNDSRADQIREQMKQSRKSD